MIGILRFRSKIIVSENNKLGQMDYLSHESKLEL